MTVCHDAAVPVAIAGKGRGLRAVRPIGLGEIIESAPTIVLSAHDCEVIERTPVGDYYFAHPDSAEDGLVVLGLTSLCNYAEAPNAEVRWRHVEGVGWLADLIAVRGIDSGEEITRRYRCHPWFDVLP